jgi:hypothetical protein
MTDGLLGLGGRTVLTLSRLRERHDQLGQVFGEGGRYAMPLRATRRVRHPVAGSVRQTLRASAIPKHAFLVASASARLTTADLPLPKLGDPRSQRPLGERPPHQAALAA